MSIEAMKQALEAFELVMETDGKVIEFWTVNGGSFEALECSNAMRRLRQAIEQAEKQKPVAWSVLDKRTGKHWYTHESRYTSQYYANQYSHRESDNTPSMIVTPLYTAPPQREWIGLTDQEILDLADEHLYNGGKARDFIYHAHDIEAKLKEKNYVS